MPKSASSSVLDVVDEFFVSASALSANPVSCSVVYDVVASHPTDDMT